MRSALLIVTAIAIGYQTFIHMIIFVCGNGGFDMRPIKFVPLVGAVLLISSALVPLRLRWTRWVALLACGISWAYFGPGVYLYFRAVARGADYFDIVLLIPSLLLLASTIYSAVSIRKQYRRVLIPGT